MSLFERLSVQDVGDAIVLLTVFLMVLVVLGVIADHLAERDR